MCSNIFTTYHFYPFKRDKKWKLLKKFVKFVHVSILLRPIDFLAISKYGILNQWWFTFLIKVCKQNKIGISSNIRSRLLLCVTLESVTSAESRFSPYGVSNLNITLSLAIIIIKSTKANCFRRNSKTLNCIDSSILESKGKRILPIAFPLPLQQITDFVVVLELPSRDLF